SSSPGMRARSSATSACCGIRMETRWSSPSARLWVKRPRARLAARGGRGAPSRRVARKQIEDPLARMLSEADQRPSHAADVDLEQLAKVRERGDCVGIRAENPALDFPKGEARRRAAQYLRAVRLNTVREDSPEQAEFASPVSNAAGLELLWKNEVLFEQRVRIPSPSVTDARHSPSLRLQVALRRRELRNARHPGPWEGGTGRLGKVIGLLGGRCFTLARNDGQILIL